MEWFRTKYKRLSHLLLCESEDGHIDLLTIQLFFEEMQAHAAAVFPYLPCALNLLKPQALTMDASLLAFP
jgi:hypothetical protein